MRNGSDPIEVIGRYWFLGAGLLVAGAALAAVTDDVAGVILGLLVMVAGLLVTLVGVVASGVRLGMAASVRDTHVEAEATPRS